MLEFPCFKNVGVGTRSKRNENRAHHLIIFLIANELTKNCQMTLVYFTRVTNSVPSLDVENAS